MAAEPAPWLSPPSVGYRPCLPDRDGWRWCGFFSARWQGAAAERRRHGGGRLRAVLALRQTPPAGLSFISTGCSSRDTSFSSCARSLTRSVISLFGRLAGGRRHDLARRGIGLDHRWRLARCRRAEQSAIAEGAGGADHRQRKHGGDRHDAQAPARRRDIVVVVLVLAGVVLLRIGGGSHSRRLARDSRALRVRRDRDRRSRHRSDWHRAGARRSGRHKGCASGTGGCAAGAVAAPKYSLAPKFGAAAGASGAGGGAAARRALSRPNSANGSVCPIRRASSASGSLSEVGCGGRRAARRRFIRTIGSLVLVVCHSVPGCPLARWLNVPAGMRRIRPNEI